MEQEYVKLYIYDTPDENSMPEANLIIELYGIFYAKRAISNVPVGVNGMIKFVRKVIIFLKLLVGDQVFDAIIVS